MSNYIRLSELIKSISVTHKFDKDELVFLNTSDVLEGKILINHYSKVSDLKGQAKKSIKNGDILYSEIRPKNRRYAYVKNISNVEDYVVSTKLMVLRNNSKSLDTDYLYHFLTYEGTINYLQKRAENRIGSFPQITFDVLKTLQIWLPDLPTQKSIAKVLSDLDAKIELNNKINRELEAMAKTLYDYWFVQFDFPNAEGKPYKSSGGKMVYNQELKREIPEGWEVKKLGDYAAIKKGTLITENTADSTGNVKVVSAGIDFSYFHSEANYLANTITISASGANAGFINFWREPIFACDCTTVRGKNTADTLQILGFLKMRQEYLYKQAKGSAQPHVYPKDIEGLLIPISPIEIIEQYGRIVVPHNDRIANNLKQNQHLTALRDWLLPMLMNGQVTVRQAHGKLETEERLNMAAEPSVDYKTKK